jgi:hypothetical protein
MHSVTFALLLWQSWIGVFGLYPDCDSLVGLPCTLDAGESLTMHCCDHIDSSHFVYCYSSVPGGQAQWAGPGSCDRAGLGYCISVQGPTDYCVAGNPVLPTMEFTNFCQKIKSTAAFNGLGCPVLVG